MARANSVARIEPTMRATGTGGGSGSSGGVVEDVDVDVGATSAVGATVIL